MKKIILLLLLSYGGIAIATNVTVNNQTNRKLILRKAPPSPYRFDISAPPNTSKKGLFGKQQQILPLPQFRVIISGTSGYTTYPPQNKDFEITITENPDKTLTISGPYGTVTSKPLP